ncbi:MAG: hypothetical protein JWO44_1644 [Bacteroidetes bacterium]|nr:hypothetical protein [Bacteroidota bacterium]
MLKAGTLFYSIVISLVIALLSGSMILLSQLSAEGFQRSLSRQELELNAASGLSLLLSSQTLVAEEEEQTIDLYKNGTDSVLLSRKFWGAFEIAVSKAIRHGQESTCIAQTGYGADGTDNYCLYVSDQDKPVAVCGTTILRGAAFLPKAGIKRAYIEGQNYTGSSLVYGEIKESSKMLPAFNKKLTGRISALAREQSTGNPSPAEENAGSRKKTNSFFAPAMIISEKPAIIIREMYSGHIAIISQTMITVDATASLEDVILYAPKILIKQGFRGNLQAFASDSILLEKDVLLDYPSVLGIVQQENAKKNAAIVLSQGDSISGSIFLCNALSSQALYPGGIIIREEVVVCGSVYTNGYADVRGSICGSLMCRNILLHTSSSVYENHLLNAVIDRTALSPYFTGISLVEEPGLKKVVKWLK